MRIKRYEAHDFSDALSQVKADLGSDAIVLSTRRFRRGRGLWGMFKPSWVEVTAAVEERPLAVEHPHRLQPNRSRISGVGIGQTQSNIGASQPAVEGASAKRTTLGSLPSYCWPIYERLVCEGVDADLAFDILIKVLARHSTGGEEELNLREALRGEMAGLLSTAGPLVVAPGVRRAVALVGPTGVGKTTTIAKLASEYALCRGHRVMLVTLDTHRIAAVEQLRIYAKILGIPMAVARKVQELPEIVRGSVDAELFLIDTAGRSHRDITHLRRLRHLLASNGGVDIHLVLSTTTRRRDLDTIVQEYARIPFDKVVLTKVDESTCFGEIFTLLAHTRVPLSYLTTGQRTPEDIELASAERIVDLVMVPWTAAGIGAGKEARRVEKGVS